MRPARFFPLVLSLGFLAGCQRGALEAKLSGNVLPETALVPVEAAMVMSLNTDLDQVAANATARKEQLQSSLNLAKAGLMAVGINYDEDLQAWVGDTLTMAVVDPNLGSVTEPIPAVLVTAKTEDAKKSSAFLEKLRQQATTLGGAEFEKKQQGQYTLYQQTNGELGSTLITAELGKGYIAVANDPTAMAPALALFERQQGVKSIATDEHFRTAVEKDFAPQPLLFAYVQPTQILADADFIKLLESAPETTETDLIKKQLTGIQSATLISRWTETGLLFRVKAHVDPKNEWVTTQVPPAKGELIKRLPANALGVATWSNMAQTWQELIAKLQKDPTSQALIKETQTQFREVTGFDLVKDVMGWMDGEGALVVNIDPNDKSPLQGFGGLIALESSQKDKANTLFKKLDALVADSGTKVQTKDSVVTWTDPSVKMVAQRSWVQNTLALTTSRPILDDFRSQPGTRLPDSPVYGPLLKALPTPNYGYLLVDWQSTLQQIEAMTPEAAVFTGNGVAQSIQALGITTYTQDPETYGADLIVTLTPQ